MSADFSGTNYLSMSHSTSFGTSHAVSLFFQADNVTGAQALWSWADSDESSGDNYHDLLLRGDVAGDPIDARTRDGTTTSGARSSAGINADTSGWHHAFGFWDGASDRRVWLDGGNSGTNTDTRNSPGKDRMRVGLHARSAQGLGFNGRIAEVAIWGDIDFPNKTDLIAALAAGCSPLLIAPQGLMAYYPLGGSMLASSNYSDITGVTGDLSGTGSPGTADHPPIMYPSGAMAFNSSAAAPGGSAPLYKNHLHKLMSA